MGKDNGKQQDQKVVVRWADDDQYRKTTLSTTRFQIAAWLTQTSLAYDKSPEEVVERFTKIDVLLEDWYTGAPLKAEIKSLLDTLYPDPAGFKPGETILGKEQDWPRPPSLAEHDE